MVKARQDRGLAGNVEITDVNVRHDVAKECGCAVTDCEKSQFYWPTNGTYSSTIYGS